MRGHCVLTAVPSDTEIIVQDADFIIREVNFLIRATQRGKHCSDSLEVLV